MLNLVEHPNSGRRANFFSPLKRPTNELTNPNHSGRLCYAGILLRLVPISSQPIGNQSNGVLIEGLILRKGRHAIVPRAVVTLVSGIRNEGHKPIARPITR